MGARQQRRVQDLEDLHSLDDVEVGDTVLVERHPKRPEGVDMLLETKCPRLGRIWVEKRSSVTSGGHR